MNQEQNNLNQNDFNTQGNNGMPNNQSLNNQSFNQGMSVNQQTPSYEQPVMQEFTPQPMDTFGGGNQGFNIKPPKKINFGLIIGAIVTVAVVGVGIAFGGKLLSNGGSENNSSENSVEPGKGNSKEEKISSDDISKYELKNWSIWINKPLGITYNIPTIIESSYLNGSKSFTYMHGSSVEYYAGYKIYVEKSLEGHNNLETLASDIIKEKKSDKYNFVYKFGSTFLTEFKNEKSQKIKIGDIDAIYFESEEMIASSAMGQEIKVKLVGYSFKYNDTYISVYGELLVEENSVIEGLKQRLQYIINSIEDYNGESLEQLGGNAKGFYDDSFNNNHYDSKANTYIVVNNYSGHAANGVLQTGMKTYGSNSRFCFEVPSDKYGSLEKISTTMDLYVKWNVMIGYQHDVLKEEKMNISDIEINKFILKGYGKNGPYNIVLAYLFEYDNGHYVCQYELNSSIYNKTKLREMSSEQEQVVISQTEAVADSMMLTLRKLHGINSTTDFSEIYSEQEKYSDTF